MSERRAFKAAQAAREAQAALEAVAADEIRAAREAESAREAHAADEARAAHEARARQDAARDALAAQAAREEAARQQAAREAMAAQAAREQAAREQEAREALLARTAREEAAREEAARAQAVREQAVREQAVREQAVREQAARAALAAQEAREVLAARRSHARSETTTHRAGSHVPASPGTASPHGSPVPMTLARMLADRAARDAELAARAAEDGEIVEPVAHDTAVIDLRHDVGHEQAGQPGPKSAEVVLLSRRQLREQTGRRSGRTPRAPRVHHLPRVGIAAALGVATIVTPVVGLGAVDAPQTADASASVAGASEPSVSRAAQTLAVAPTVSADFSILPVEKAPTVAPPPSMVSSVGEVLSVDELAAIRTQAEQASRAQQRAALPGCKGKVTEKNGANGRLDTDDLCEIWVDGLMLRADAALALGRLNADFAAEFDDELCITDAYRSYSAQVRVRGQKPGLAARPGTSQHGWGLAVDLCDGEGKNGSKRFEWMRDNAPDFGWDNPEWARSGGSGPYEPWHWEYVAGQEDDGS